MGRTAGKFGIGRQSPGGVETNGSLLSLLKIWSVAIDLASLAAGAESDTDVTVTGVTTDDMAVAIEPQTALTAGLEIVGLRVKAANTVTVRVRNNTGGAVDEVSKTFKILTVRCAAADL